MAKLHVASRNVVVAKEEKALEDKPDQPDMSMLAQNTAVTSARMKQIQEKDTPAVEDSALQADPAPFIRQRESVQSNVVTSEEPDLVAVVHDIEEESTLFYKTYEFKFPEENQESVSAFNLKGKFHILLLADSFKLCNEGVAAINRCLASQLVSTNAGTVTCTVYDAFEKMSQKDLDAAKKMDIKLVSLSNVCRDFGEPHDYPVSLYRDVVSSPAKYASVFNSPEPSDKFVTYTHIIGHVPVTHEYAMSLKQFTFRLSKLFIFFHVIPADMATYKDSYHESTIEVPSLKRLIEIARHSEVVYSVSRKVFDYFTIAFRTNNIIDINHRLYLPSAPVEVFNMTFCNHFYNKITFLTNGFLCDSTKACSNCNGLDICLDALKKLEKEDLPVEESDDKMILKLLISHLPNDEVLKAQEELSAFGDTSMIEALRGDAEDLELMFHETNFYLSPRRCENYGFQGLYPFCVGLPTLIPEDSIAASVISEVYADAHEFIVPVYKNPAMYKQNSSILSKKLKHFIKNYEEIKVKASELKSLLLVDEKTRDSHDDFLSLVLGGIRMKIRVVSLVPLDSSEKDNTSLRLNFENLMLKIMRVCWRLKSHETEYCTDHSYISSQIITGVILPIDRFIHEVFDRIEDYNRRVVAIDDETKSLVIFCPTQTSLRHLWAKCTNISKSFMDILDEKTECNSLLNSLKIKSVEAELIIEGSEFYQLSQFLENVYEKM